MTTSEGAVMTAARRRSLSPRERRLRGAWPAGTDAASIVRALERLQRLVDLRLRRLEGVLRRLGPGQGLVDVLVDRLGDLRVHGRDRPGLGLRRRLLQLGRERDRK